MYVRKKARKNRTIQDLILDVQQGVYSGVTLCNRKHKPIDSKITNGWRKKIHENMNSEIKNVLKIENMTINNLCNDSSNTIYKIGYKHIKYPWTAKTLKLWRAKFEVVLL